MSNKPVVIQSDAEADIKDAYQWYESQRKGLGESFLHCTTTKRINGGTK